MKVLLDECLPLGLRHHFPGHEAHTVQWAGFKGLLNGKLLRSAELAGYLLSRERPARLAILIDRRSYVPDCEDLQQPQGNESRRIPLLAESAGVGADGCGVCVDHGVV